VPSTLGVVASGEDVLNDAVFWIDAALSSTVSGAATNLGKGGSALNAQYGSTSGSDTNDPTLLTHTGTNYLYLPGISGNFVSCPDPSVLAGVAALDVRAWVAAADWTPSAGTVICAQSATSDQNFRFYIASGSTGRITLDTSTNGTTFLVATSSAAPTITDGSALGIRATWRASDGRVQFFTKAITTASDVADNTGWTQLGTDQTGVVGNTFNSTRQLTIGTNSSGTSEPFAGLVYRVWIATTIDGTTVFDANFTTGITSGGQATFTESSANAATVTINRATSGRKSVAVVRPVLLFGTDDYLEVADNDLLDFGASDSFTVAAIHRAWGTQATGTSLVAKKANATATTQGWMLGSGTTTALQGQGQVGDGTNGTTATSASRTAGAVSTSTLVRNVTADTLTTYLGNTAGTPVTDATTGTLVNSEPVRVGRLTSAGTGYFEGELVAVAVWRRVLSTNEIATVVARYA